MLAGCQVSAPPLGTLAPGSAVDAPRLESFAVNADPAQWKNNGLRIDVLNSIGPRHPDDADAFGRLAWNERGVLLLLNVTDDAFHESDNDIALWSGDSVEMFISAAVGSPDMAQVIISPGLDPKHPALRKQFWETRAGALRNVPMSAEVAVRKHPGGYVLQVLMPWDQIGVKPAVGTEIGVQIYVTDIDGSRGRNKLLWFPQDGANRDKTRVQRVRLAESAGPPIEAAASGQYDHFRQVKLSVAATARFAGHPVQVWEGNQRIGQGTFKAAGRLATAALTLPMPSDQGGYGPLTIASGREALARVQLPDLHEARQTALQRAPLKLPHYCFTGKTFPAPEFESPESVSEAVGSFQFRTTYYDADFNAVTHPTRPGRYGAIVQVISQYARPITDNFTLFYYDKPLDWHDTRLQGSLPLPANLGIDPAIVRRQSAAMSDLLRRALWTSVTSSQDSSITLAGLSEMSPDAADAPLRLGVRQRNDDWWYALRKKLGQISPYHYLVRQPTAASPSGKVPLLIFLHGRGDGDVVARTAANGPIKEVDGGRELPFLIIAPQCPSPDWWDVNKLEDMLKEVLADHPEVDTRRIYLTGLSMGGYGSWSWATMHPEHFAALAPIAGGGDPSDVQRLKDLPIWVFHGDRDTTVSPQESYDMVAALRAIHGRVRFTLYPNTGHDSWTQAYATAELYQWMLRQQLGKPAEPPSTQAGTQPSR
jgi:pimeloyl-ACP methyl ester carboxylesterase